MKQSKLRKEVEALFYKHSHGVQIPIMDLGKIMQAGEYAAPEVRELAIIEAIAKYRVAK